MVQTLMVLAVLCAWATLHPFTTYPLSLRLLARLRPRRPAAVSDVTPEPDLAILMCAYNEERVIEGKIANLRLLKELYPGIEVYVYVDASSDRTAELLRPHQDFIRLVVSSERTGKTPGMNLLMSMVTQPIVMFTDANVRIDPDAPANLMRHFADPTVGCVAAHLIYTNEGASITAGSGSDYWRLEETIKLLETELGSCIGADGSLFAMRRELHRPPPPEVCDDFYVSLQVLCQGKRVVQARDVCAYEASVTSASEEFRRKARIACQSFRVHQLLWPSLRRLSPLIVYGYLSHKWLRWLTLLWLCAAAACFELALALGGHADWAFAAGAAGALALSLGYLGWSRPLARVWDILEAFAGTGLGVLQALRGRDYRIWTPAASIRAQAEREPSSAIPLGPERG